METNLKNVRHELPLKGNVDQPLSEFAWDNFLTGLTKAEEQEQATELAGVPLTPEIKNKTDYALVTEFIHYLLTLSFDELTQFYCEGCIQKMDMPAGKRPPTPFHENTGTCVGCNRHDDVSNPAINQFMNERQVQLDSPQFLFKVGGSEDETTELIRDWLIPDDWRSFRETDSYYKVDVAESWVSYGRKQEKQAYKRQSISERSRQVLLTFFPHFYSAERYARLVPLVLTPVEEPATSVASVKEPDEYSLDYAWPATTSWWDTLSSFVINLLMLALVFYIGMMYERYMIAKPVTPVYYGTPPSGMQIPFRYRGRPLDRSSIPPPRNE